MFYVIEKIKGTPDDVGGLLFGSDHTYDYFIKGCPTPTVKMGYGYDTTDSWKSDKQTLSVSKFIKLIGAISERKDFTFNIKRFHY